MAKQAETVIRKGLEAALALAAEMPWAELTLAAIADKAGLDLSEFHGVTDKAGLADAAAPYFDKAMFSEAADMDDAPRERLFDVLMLRYEAMEPHRVALLSLHEWRMQNPATLAKLPAARMKTAKWALTCAGLDGKGTLPMSLRKAGIAWAIGQTDRAWRKETSEDFTRTMAELDKQLRSADERASWVSRFSGRRSAEPED